MPLVNPLTSAVGQLKNFGFFDVILPMLLVFLIVYAILVRTEILGESTKGFVRAINALISASIAFLFITETSLVEKMNTLLPRASLLLVITMLVLLLLAFVGVYKTDVFEGAAGWKLWLIAIPLIVIFLGIVDVSGINIPIIHQVIMAFSGGAGVDLAVSSETVNIGLAVLIAALVLGLIIYIVGSEG